MKRLAFVGLGMAAGFSAALMLFPAAHGANDSAYKQLDLFSDAFERVRADYVHPVEDGQLVTSAIQGMVSGLDPHSSYMDAKAFADMKIQTKGKFGGLGLEVTMEDGLVKVISPIDDTPAAKAGIKPGDFIAAIDGTPIQGMQLNDAVDRMRGAAGSKITLTVLRSGAKKPFDVALTRAIVQVDSVKFHRDGDIGYVRLSAFNEETASGLEHAIKELKHQIGPGIKGYVLDLRNNPGGLLDQAVQVSDDFLNSGEIVSTRGRHPEDTARYDSKPGDITDGKPLVVLINAGTASASEIVAGALQDHKRATVEGMTSFGKGSVQTIIPLGPGGGALRLTTARYYTPSGRSIQATGIVPDISVAESDDDQNGSKLDRISEANLPGHLNADGNGKKAAPPVIRPPAGKKIEDFQLSYALDLLHGKPAAAAPAKTAAAN
ncbi:MAG TPA: S41 family peptidase [Rhizomicrobium sp.]|jgi:carboxyl-terminal processing protease|nr:S41 family peptidase [Rhizomicrobium sp.]